MNKVSGVYKITNTVTGDFYIGSSKNVRVRWADHKKPCRWNKYNNRMYKDMQKYGLDKFEFRIIIATAPEYLKEAEQNCIELMKPTYNSIYAKGLNVERHKNYNKEYNIKYRKTDKYNEYIKSDKYNDYQKKYHSQLCFYNGEELTLAALSSRFRRAGISNPVLEAKKYLIK